MTNDSYATDRTSANDALLARLDEAKRAFGAVAKSKAMLDDPVVSALVNELLLLNRPWLMACVAQEKRRMGLRESVTELASTAIAGKGDSNREVAGAMGAILKYDFAAHGVGNFTSFLRKAIHDALALTPRERRTLARSSSLEASDALWADRERSPRVVAMDAELMQVVWRNVEKLAEGQRAVAQFVIGTVLDGGRRPTSQELADFRGVSRARAGQLYELTFDRLKALIEQDCPDLAKAGVGGWDEFNAVFGKTRTSGEVQR